MKTKVKSIHGTGEWADKNINIQTGCEHDCRYCYAKCMAIRFGRSTTESWCKPVLRPEPIKIRKNKGMIMFPSTHDITPRNIDTCIAALNKLLVVGNKVLIVSKPHLKCVKRMCRELDGYKEQVLFRFTIGSTSNATLAYWEPGAPEFQERLESLKWAHAQGYRTSISCEPMLDNKIKALVKKVEPFVTDAIWFGRINRLRQRLAINCPADQEARQKADALIALWPNEAVIKLHAAVGDNPKIRWKDGLKKVLGIQQPTVKGMDI